jgi:hypothetical protein
MKHCKIPYYAPKGTEPKDWVLFPRDLFPEGIDGYELRQCFGVPDVRCRLLHHGVPVTAYSGNSVLFAVWLWTALSR